ncbi:MAG: precorrin-6A reductase [Methanobrevibacter sp.]|nr:precorrin-6A reductase [Methanobrevibacter sp.]
MHKIVLFGGTTEGRLLTEFLSQNKIPAIVCVATEYGEKVLEYEPPVIVQPKRLKPGPMRKLFEEEQTEFVFDATHPYATEISKHIKEICEEQGIEYIRVLRESIEIEDAVKVSSMEDLIDYLNTTEGLIFSSMGAKEAPALTDVENFQERVYLRMLPSPEGMKQCLDLGYPMKNLCGMQGPFSKEFNIAQFKEIGADILVTKDSGNVGGFLEKTDAAKECGMEVVVLSRLVNEEGISVEEAKDTIRSKCL